MECVKDVEPFSARIIAAFFEEHWTVLVRAGWHFSHDEFDGAKQKLGTILANPPCRLLTRLCIANVRDNNSLLYSDIWSYNMLEPEQEAKIILGLRVGFDISDPTSLDGILRRILTITKRREANPTIPLTEVLKSDDLIAGAFEEIK
jgi:hypothetical protein